MLFHHRITSTLLLLLSLLSPSTPQLSFSLIQTLTESKGNIHGCAISTSKLNMVAAQFDAIGRIYQNIPNTNQWQTLETISSGAGNQFFEVDISLDSTLILLGGTNNVSQIYKLNPAGTFDLFQTLPNTTAAVWTVRFTNDKSFLSIGAKNGNLHLFKRNPNGQYTEVVKNTECYYATGGVHGVHFTVDNNLLVACCYDGITRIYGVSTTGLTLKQSFNHGLGSTMWSAKFSVDGTVMITTASDGYIRYYKNTAGTVNPNFVLTQSWRNSTSEASMSTMSLDKRTLVVSSLDSNVYVYNFNDLTGQYVYKQVLGESQLGVWSVALTADSQVLIAGSNDTKLRVYCAALTSCVICTNDTYMNSLGLCVKCPTGCSSCASSSYCSGCIAGYYLNSSTCQQCPSTCTVCESATSCSACITGYYVSSNQCVQCVGNCTVCTTATSCSACASGYYLSGASCPLCVANCTACSGAATCSACAVGYYHNGTACPKCVANCTACSTATTCSSCDVGYYFSSPSCPSCITNCTACSAPSTCSSCGVGYYQSGTSCPPCVSNCTACSAIATCTSCSTGYYLNGNQCPPCISNCTACSSVSSCSSCQSGYYLSGTACPPCINNCSTCTTASTCQTCSSGYYLSGTSCPTCPTNCTSCSSATICSTCSTGYYYDGVSCPQCIANCTACSALSTCSSCSLGYYLHGTQCPLCIPNCTSCSTPNNCTSCSLGYYLTPSDQCPSCLSNCTSCTSQNSCQSCSLGYYLLGDQCPLCTTNCTSCTSPTHCSTCSDGFYPSGTSCPPCPSNCTKCSSSNVCTSCNPGYYFSPPTCPTCTAGCSICNSATECLTCFDGYYNNNGICAICGEHCNICNTTFCFVCDHGIDNINGTCVNPVKQQAEFGVFAYIFPFLMTFTCLACCIGVNCHYFYTHGVMRRVRVPEVNDSILKPKKKINSDGIGVNKKPLIHDISNFSVKTKGISRQQRRKEEEGETLEIRIVDENQPPATSKRMKGFTSKK